MIAALEKPCEAFVNWVRRPLGVSLCWGLFFAAACLFFLFSGHIDFHPDETIYFDGIPLSLRNDTGLFYSVFYQAVMFFKTGPEGARLASSLLGAGSLLFVLLILWDRKRSWGEAVLAFFVFVVSYQAVFIFDRVRPEAAWWFLTAACCWSVSRFEKNSSPLNYGWVLFFAYLLPMNHRLSWFACAFLAGYALLFFRKPYGVLKALGVPFAMGVGVVVNIFARALLLGVPLASALQTALDAPRMPRPAFSAFFRNVFYDAPVYLTDKAYQQNLYEKISGLESGALVFLSHSFVQTALWASLFVLPFMGKSWRARYILAFPLFAFGAFFMSGYYNPTYTAGFSLFCVLGAMFLLQAEHKIVRLCAGVVVGVSLVNGVSFLATRVMDHGQANYFEAENKIFKMIAQDSSLKAIALPERFQGAARGFKGQRFMTYKDPFLANIDLLIVDSYDEDMYRFVPTYEDRKKDIQDHVKKLCLVETMRVPVYEGDSLYPEAQSYLDKQTDIVYQGSWFFRNSTAFGLSIYKSCP